MSTARLGVLSAVVVILVAMVSWWQGAPPEGRKLSLNSSVAAVGNSESLSSTWFCSAGGIGAEPAPQHLVRLTNSSEAPAQVRVSAFNADGKVGEKSIEVPGASVSSVDVSAQFKGSDLSVMVESPVGSLAVGHTLVSSDMADSVPCETHSSDSWYFPAQTTLA
ncbi:MAG TPA: hypothetical protein VL068_08215, partial [Microthrixaceae bacterium]|nr:hypothetical protein [Microthrixaceae bacterium]